MKKVYLDFDGVIFDTAYEAYLVLILTMGRANGLQEAKLFSSTDINYDLFYQFRYLIGPAWNYFYLFHWLTKEGGKGTPKIPKKPSEDAMSFQSTFFQTRKKIREDSYTDWLTLNTLYEGSRGFIDLLNDFSDSVRIVSTKDRETIENLLQSQGLAKPVTIHSADAFDLHGSKSEIIIRALSEERVNSAIFVDDCFAHIEQCQPIDCLKCIQAGWGYTAPGTHQNTPTDVVRELRQFLNS